MTFTPTREWLFAHAETFEPEPEEGCGCRPGDPMCKHTQEAFE